MKYFSETEIEAVSDNPDAIDSVLLTLLDDLRELLNRRVKLISLNSGIHQPDSYHYKGMAADFVLYVSDGYVDSYAVFKACLHVGFKGIGIYWNGKGHSFHADIRQYYGFWSGVKNFGDSKWKYGPLILDPKRINNYD